MKKFYLKFKENIVTVIIMLLIIILFSSYSFIGGNINNNLINKNYQLKTEFNSIEKKILRLKQIIDSLNNYDKYINQQILGLNPDTFYVETIIDGESELQTMDSDSLSLDDKLDLLDNIITTKLDETKKTVLFTKQNEFILNSFPNISPVKKIINLMSSKSKFGLRMHPIKTKYLFHSGIDISASIGTEIYSTISGFVVSVVYSNSGYGNHVRIRNGFEYETLYAHLSKSIYVKEGEFIEKGQLIAKSGNSGLSTSPHLHYGIKYRGKYVNPLNYIFQYRIKGILVDNIKL